MEAGFIQSMMDIKVLILYILSRAEQELTLDTITDVIMCDPGITYFDFTTALAQLVDTDHVTRSAGVYDITDKGRQNGAVMEKTLPHSVRMRCDLRLTELKEQLRQQRKRHTSLTQQEDGSWMLQLGLDGEEDECLFALSVRVSLKEDGRRLVSLFRADPRAFYRSLTERGDRNG